jgi:hypothetical protein
VYGWPLPEHAWRFRVATNEPAISHGENAGHSRHVWVSDWNAVLALLDEWPWAVFYPLYVNPTFREAVFRDSHARAGEHFQMEAWNCCLREFSVRAF